VKPFPDTKTFRILFAEPKTRLLKMWWRKLTCHDLVLRPKTTLEFWPRTTMGRRPRTTLGIWLWKKFRSDESHLITNVFTLRHFIAKWLLFTWVGSNRSICKVL